MDSGMYGKIEKAKRYTEERDRIAFQSFTADFKGANHDHHVKYADGIWECTCDYFTNHKICPHTMAMEMILDQMVQPVEGSEV